MRAYRVVVVILHVVHNSGVRGGVFACLVRHLDVASIDDWDYAMGMCLTLCWGSMEGCSQPCM